ncbi:MAG TPA: ATP-binding protein [Gemmatimonadaceae bacterium]|nr:ATP-binding protein [Gemmatimonadaceae bacterium]
MIARRLRFAFGAYVALVALMLTFLVRTTSRTVDADGANRDVSALLRGLGDARVATTASELEQQEIATRVMREASQIAVTAEFARTERAARSARITAWVLAAGAMFLGAVLWILLGRATQLERMKRELVSNASHDLKSPLSSMQEVNAAMLDGVAGPLVEAQRRLLLANQDSAQRLASMVGKLLELSRLESKPAVRRDHVDVGSVARTSVARAQPRLRVGQELTASIDDVLPVIRADRDEIERVFDNLIENAIKFSPPATVIGVDVHAEDGWIVARVSDHGPGVRDADKQHVFERFYQTDVGRATRMRGLGLGLTICRSIVTEHRGSIDVSDNHPAGAVFTVRFPAARAAARAGRMAETARSQRIPARSRTA